MAQESSSINMPGAFGGLMRYSDEYESRFMLKPTHIIAFVILVILIRAVLPMFFPLLA